MLERFKSLSQTLIRGVQRVLSRAFVRRVAQAASHNPLAASIVGGGALIFLLGLSPELYIGLQKPIFNLLNTNFGLPEFIWENVTELGNAYLLLCCLSFLILVYPRAWAAVLGSIPLALILSQGGKWFFAMPRPAKFLDLSEIHIIGEPLQAANSLPSGHTLTVFAALSAVGFTIALNPDARRPILRVSLIFALALIIGLSRVMVGAHWPLDVVAGALLGTMAGFSGVWLSYKFPQAWSWMNEASYFYVHLILLTLLCLGLINDLWHLPLAYLGIHMAYLVMGLIAYRARSTLRIWMKGFGLNDPQILPPPESTPPRLAAFRQWFSKISS